MNSLFLSATVAGLLSSAGALTVTTPEEGSTWVGGKTYSVEWTGTGANQRFEIDLYYCGSYCMEDDCGTWVTALCPYGADGCPDNMGDYDVTMPEPMTGTSGDSYKIRVMNVADESQMDCSDEFFLMSEAEVPITAAVDGAYLIVTSPSEGDVAEPGGEYTVLFDYNDGMGITYGRFKIDLYSAGGTGDCGTWVTSICDKPTIGCKDSKGDYDVVIPEDTTPGYYSIRVGDFYDDSLYGCSEIFAVSEDGDMPDDDESFSYLY